MKIAPRDTMNFLRSPGNVRGALFFGPDEGLVRERRDALLKALLKNPADDLSTLSLPAEKVAAEPSLLFEALSSLSLLGDAPVVVLHHATDKLAASVKEALTIPECKNFLLVCAGDLLSRSSLRDVFEKDKVLASIGCYREEGASLEQLIRGLLEERKIRYDRETLRYLAGHLGNDRAVTRQEIEKIDLYLGQERLLSVDTARQLTGGNAEENLDHFIAALLDKKSNQACQLMERLFLEGENSISLIRTLARHVERLYKVKHAATQGESVQQAMEKLKPPVFYKQKPAFTRQVNAYSAPALSALLIKLLTAEAALKRAPDQEIFSKQLMLNLAAA